MALSDKYPNKRLFVSTVIIAFFGTGAMCCIPGLNAAQSIIKVFVNQSVYDHYGVALSKAGLSMLWSGLVITVNIGGICGCLHINRLTSRFGRRDTCLLLNSFIIIVGSVLMGIAKPCNCFELLFVGGFIMGHSLGILGIIGFYLAECAPVSCRGFVGGTSTFIIYLWAVIAYGLGLTETLGSETLWPLLMAFPAFPAICALCICRVFHESPKYLYINKEDETRAIQAINFYHGNDADTKAVLTEYRRESEEANVDAKHQASLRTIWRTPHLRRALWVSVMVAVAMDVIGTDFVAIYSTTIFEDAGFSHSVATYASLICSLVGMIAGIGALSIIERVGRRPLIIVSMFLATVANLFLTLQAVDAKLAVVGIMIIFVSHHGGVSLIAYFIPGEVCPTPSRGNTSMVAWTCHWIVSVIIVFCFPILEAQIGNATYLLFIVSCLLATVWFWFYLPETKGKAVDEIIRAWMKNPKENQHDNYRDELSPLVKKNYTNGETVNYGGVNEAAT